METAELSQAKIPATSIENFDDLAKRLSEIRRLPQEGRQAAFNQLLTSASLKDSEHTVADEVMSQTSRSENSEPTVLAKNFAALAEKAASRVQRQVQKPAFRGLVVSMAGSEVADVAIQNTYPQRDPKGLRRMQMQMPSGPGRLVHVSTAPGRR